MRQDEREALIEMYRGGYKAIRLTPEQWLREGTHSEVGAYSVEAWLRIYSEHAHRHARQIREATERAKGKG